MMKGRLHLCDGQKKGRGNGEVLLSVGFSMMIRRMTIEGAA